MLAAARCFARRGFDATTTADICAEAGIGSGTLFHYFANKRAMFHAVFEQDSEDQAAHARAALDQASPLEGLWLLVDLLVKDAREREYLGLVFEAIQQAGRDEAFAELLMRTEAATVEALAILVQQCMDDGMIEREGDATQTAGWVQSLTDIVYIRLASDESLEVEEELATMRDVITGFLRIPG